MKIFSLAVILAPPSGPGVTLSQASDLSSFSFYQKGSVGEFMSFFAKTVAERTPQGQRQSVQENNYTAHVYNRGGAEQLAAVIITDQEYPVRPAFSLLTKLLDDFTAKVPQSAFSNPSAISFPDVNTYIQKYQDPRHADNIMRVQQELDETKIVLHKTIESVLQRGEKLDNLVERSNALSAQSKMFYKTAKKGFVEVIMAVIDIHSSLGPTNTASVLVNGNLTPLAHSDDEPRDQDSLEQFRKEAIFRRMRHYSRENERNQARVAELERLKVTYEASLAAMGACWTQLVETIRALVKPDSMPPVDLETQDLLHLSKHISSDQEPALSEALAKKVEDTSSFLAAFVQLGGSVPSQDDMFKQHLQSQTECIALRAELSVTRARLEDRDQACAKFHSDLAAAQNRLDRLQSRTVQATLGNAPLPSGDESSPVVLDEGQTGEVKIKESSVEVKSEEQSTSTPTPTPEQWTAASTELEKLQTIVLLRDARITKLEAEHHSAHEQIAALRVDRVHPSPETIQQLPEVVALNAKMEAQARHDKEERQRLEDEIARLNTALDTKDMHAKQQDNFIGELRQALERSKLDLTRVRDQREQHAAEILERKKKDDTRRTALQELKILAESRSERIDLLRNEVTRLKALLAAKAGDEELVSFISREKSGDTSYVQDLQSRLEASESRVSVLETQLKYFGESHPDVAQHIRSEAEAQQQLADAQKLLHKYQSVYGEPSTSSADVKQLSEKLARKEEEMKALQLQEAQRAESEGGLYAELERLSSAWESLDQQLKSKVYDLAAMEERMVKTNIEKAKVDNKCYAAIRAKDVFDQQVKGLTREKEKQAVVLEKRKAELEAAKNVQVHSEEIIKKLNGRIEELEAKATESQTKAAADEEEMRARRFELKKFDYLAILCQKENESARRENEQLSLQKKEADKQIAAAKARPLSTSQKEAELQKELEKCMSVLKCSTCRMNMRSTVLSKCLHTFCKDCIEARISTRQRKCPACNLAFAQSDVQQIYFQ
ncbi:hypothetical protein BV25DRAFT_1915177 [Artomyces pyxidatus]|uniref:Uncharacterized protein n=1 Tax=Artomyces pyxidatus TaxID=48021 RepID=A0ACB8T6F8_9AGAM|nr:hypothetical protein BV25DRAFT_1915177 [Artomyces pyxidatus]